MDPSNYDKTTSHPMGGPMKYKGPVGHFNAEQISRLKAIQGGLTQEQQAQISMSQFEKEQAEKNARPGATSPVTQTFINPVESKFTGEQLIAYNRYIERGYTPEIAEYLVTRT